MMKGKDSKMRCGWAYGGDERYLAYHDQEWGVPIRDDAKQFEFLVLESAQAGLSWSTVLYRREGYRRAFAGFDVKKVARFTDKRVEKLLFDTGIIRNRMKVQAAVNNARRFLEVQEEFGSFCDYIWGFVNGQPLENHWQSDADLPATSGESDVLAKDMKRRGFKFIGSTIIYAHLQATGLINDHLTQCYRHVECKRLGKRLIQG